MIKVGKRIVYFRINHINFYTFFEGQEEIFERPLDNHRKSAKVFASDRSTLKLAEKMKWKYIGNRAGDATKGEQYIVEINEEMEEYAKKDMPQFITVVVVQPPSPRNNTFFSMRTGDIIRVCNPYYEMMKYSHPGFVPVKE